MFKKKITVTLIDDKWNIVKNRISFTILPRVGEYIYFDDVYYEVLNLIHRMDDNKGVFIIVNQPPHQIKPTDKQ
jgi:hypothetical protein